MLFTDISTSCYATVLSCGLRSIPLGRKSLFTSPSIVGINFGGPPPLLSRLSEWFGIAACLLVTIPPPTNGQTQTGLRLLNRQGNFQRLQRNIHQQIRGDLLQFPPDPRHIGPLR